MLRECPVTWILSLATINDYSQTQTDGVKEYMVKVKIKQSPYRPEQALRVKVGWVSQISRQSAHEGGKVVNPTHRPPLLPKEIFLVLISVRDWVNPRVIVRPARFCKWKILMTPSGIERATLRFVAQCLKQLRHRVTPNEYMDRKKNK